MKATLVHDIRRHQLVPGAVEFNALQRTMFWSCPCGCGLIGDLDLRHVFAARNPVDVRAMVIGPDGKNAPGELLPMGIIIERGGSDEIHWAGTLQAGEWSERNL